MFNACMSYIKFSKHRNGNTLSLPASHPHLLKSIVLFAMPKLTWWTKKCFCQQHLKGALSLACCAGKSALVLHKALSWCWSGGLQRHSMADKVQSTPRNQEHPVSRRNPVCWCICCQSFPRGIGKGDHTSTLVQEWGTCITHVMHECSLQCHVPRCLDKVGLSVILVSVLVISAFSKYI